jgi:membrane protease YdiL (CAAX protease family)
VDERELAVPVTDVAAAATAPAEAPPLRARPLPRWFAVVQALAVSGVPTGLLVAFGVVMTTNIAPFEGNGLSLEFLSTVTLLDTALIALLIRVFLELSGEDSRGVFLGRRPVLGEMIRGILLVPVMFAAVTAIVLGLRTLAPWLHTVKVSPLEQYMHSPLDASIFLIVVVLGGGVREELQRAFILHRFEQCLGGIKLGLVVFSVVFGLLHVDQGGDVAIAVGSLGLFWGLLYVKRRSAVMGMTNHAGFNALQVLQGVLARSLGV